VGTLDSVVRIDQATNTIIATILVAAVGGELNEIAIDPSNTYIWASTTIDGINDIVVRIEIATNTISGSLPVGNFPEGIAVSPDNSTVWVANNGNGTVSYIDVASFTVGGFIHVGLRPIQLVVSSDSLYVYVVNNSSGTVSKISSITKTVIDTYTVGTSPNDIAISSDNSTLWVANYDSGTISVISSASGSLLHTINIYAPYALAISPDSSVWVVSKSVNTVTQFNAVTYAVIAVVPIGGYPFALAINPDSSAVLFSNTHDNTVTKLSIPLPPTSFRVERLPVSSGGSARLLLTISHGCAVDLTSYVQAVDGSPLLFSLPLNIGGSVTLAGSVLTALQTTPYLPITVSTAGSCSQQPASMILMITLTVPAYSTPTEQNYLLASVATCPLYTVNQLQASSNPCSFTVGPTQGTFTPFQAFSPTPLSPYPYVTTPPVALHQYRSVPRIRGIDQIATVVRGQSSSEATTRRQTAILRGNVSPTTTFFRKPVPLAPCPASVIPPLASSYPPAPPCRPHLR